MNLWLLIFVGGVITYLIRLSLILLYGRFNMPEPVQRGLRFIPAAVFAAIVFPELFTSQGQLSFSLDNARMIAGLLAALVAWRTKNIIFTVLIGMAALIFLQSLP